LEVFPVARVLPSQVVEFIETVFPWVTDAAGQTPPGVGISHRANIAALVELVDEIPGELIALDGSDYVGLRVMLAEFRSTLNEWVRFDRRGAAPAIGESDRSGGLNPVAYLHQLLQRCPDEVPASIPSGLDFISDEDYRREILLDIGSVGRAVSNGEWKAATVLAGGVAEALLLASLQSLDQTGQGDARAAAGRVRKRTPADMQDWGLAQLIAGAETTGIIKADTVRACDLAQNFRNLIHPGRALRLATTCDRGTAYSAVGAMDHVVRDLSAKAPLAG
jgi:hypothetical protein